MNKALLVCIWVICIVSAIDESLNMISQASTVENIMGFLFLIIMVLISIKTKCFTSFKERKNEKSN